MPKPYNLLIATGKSPQVITETIFEIYRLEDRVPRSVHVITTQVGRIFGEALLLGRDLTDPTTGKRVSEPEDRWTPFCRNVFGEEALGTRRFEQDPPIDLTFYVPDVEGQPLPDIRRRGDDTRFGNTCYEQVEKLTREGQFDLIGSIAGGRKTMGAHVMTAFSVYARPDDRLTHVLVTDPELEYDPSFFYPPKGTPRYGDLLDLVDVPFPRLRALLESDLIEGLPEDRRDLQGILDALEPHIASMRSVEQITLELHDHKAHLVFTGGQRGAELARCRLPPKAASTLVVFAEHRAGHDAAVPAPHFVDNDEVETQRTAVAKLCGVFAGDDEDDGAFARWSSTNDFSKALTDLKDAVKNVPLAARFFTIEGISSDPRRHDWPEDPPPLTVASPHTREAWPFKALSPLAALDSTA